MALRKIITLENEILRKVSKLVTRFDENLWDLLDDMKETLIKSTGVGLAAPQVTYLMHELRAKGLPVNMEATTVEEAKESILRALKK